MADACRGNEHSGSSARVVRRGGTGSGQSKACGSARSTEHTGAPSAPVEPSSTLQRTLKASRSRTIFSCCKARRVLTSRTIVLRTISSSSPCGRRAVDCVSLSPKCASRAQTAGNERAQKQWLSHPPQQVHVEPHRRTARGATGTKRRGCMQPVQTVAMRPMHGSSSGQRDPRPPSMWHVVPQRRAHAGAGRLSQRARAAPMLLRQHTGSGNALAGGGMVGVQAEAFPPMQPARGDARNVAPQTMNANQQFPPITGARAVPCFAHA